MPGYRDDPAVYRGRGVARYRLPRGMRQRAGPLIRGRPGGCRAVRAFGGTLADRILASALAAVSHQTGTPAGAVTASMTLTFALLLALGLAGTGTLTRSSPWLQPAPSVS